jgi:Spy/CpxP family protein refolding chaperone
MRGGRPGRGGQRGGQHALRATLRGVNLSEAQRTQLRTIAERYRTERQGWRAEARKQWEAQRGQAAGRQPGAAPDSATRAARQAFRTQQAERMRASMERELADVRGILTAEQRPTFDRNVAELRSRMQDRQQARRDGRVGRAGR